MGLLSLLNPNHQDSSTSGPTYWNRKTKYTEESSILALVEGKMIEMERNLNDRLRAEELEEEIGYSEENHLRGFKLLSKTTKNKYWLGAHLIQEYIRPRQCFKCYKFGHLANLLQKDKDMHKLWQPGTCMEGLQSRL
ncbi:hypothetical protein CEXT_704591 [Caerostris extrusa]|uniref:Uncharacterized protein n=1 Tax=Caerostris extrusa TaxID=172846 RepID=A0AAV4NSU2_CAEEX|nr:hypothetical protein CEXT_704591 [Caerostris extrusa]